ncbi:oligoendopeptidase F [Staphylococcus hyicus]|uniref:oligoendopeptidase F n=1 Tax=Staphylococcus hyicus TaxID=1284 RepID=UPI000D1F3A3D|nr:oligoendopeptidase F [Staphylococcus hyicus]PTJ72172.1 oligoendopeptidase F [Staphylococcus hyicus]PTJ88757.1 oligoendopeptidase F [Staphylococcus hyicus]
MTQKLKPRKDVPVSETWDLRDIYESDVAFEHAINTLVTKAEVFHKRYATTIHNAESIEKVLDALCELTIEIDRVANYSHLQLSVESTDPEKQRLNALFSQKYGKISSQLTFVESELLHLDKAILQSAIKTSKYDYYLKRLLKKQPHQLHPEAEKVLAEMVATLNVPYDLYEVTKMLDIDFGQFEVNGQVYDMDYTTFEGVYEDDPNTELRRQSFKHFSETLRKYQHTTAAVYQAHVQNEKLEANLRGYNSVIDFLLEDHDVHPDMYHRQIDIIMSDLAPIMRRYARLLKKVHQLDSLKYEDLKISIDPDYEPQISIKDSEQYIYNALGVLGEDYLKMTQSAYNERWIDFPQNKGKETGAYCASPYFTHSYIFISWTGKMNEVFVLAHELGHAGHFHLAQSHQNILHSESSMYFVEAPSTMNEMLMAQYLLEKNSEDPRFKRWVLSSLISRTYYHNMVTHLLEAAFQREVYRCVDRGEYLTADKLNAIKKQVIETFWGDDVELTPGSELTWMRQPHYYMGLYPYTYSAGLTIGTLMAQRIKHEGQKAVNEWLEVLKAGGSMSPVELAQIAHIDMTSEKPLKDTIQFIGSLVEEIENLTQQI